MNNPKFSQHDCLNLFIGPAAGSLLAACNTLSPNSLENIEVVVEKPTASLKKDTPTSVSEATPTTTSKHMPTPVLPAALQNLHWLGIASIRLDGPPTIYFDPVSLSDDQPPADIILITHSHGDHLAEADIKQISTDKTVVVVSPWTAKGLPKDIQALPGGVHTLPAGKQITVGEVEIEAIPAYGMSYHPTSLRGTGFIVTVNGERLYHAGGAGLIPEMADIRCDIALLPIYDLEEVIEMANDIESTVIIPMHLDVSIIETAAKCVGDRYRKGEAITLKLEAE